MTNATETSYDSSPRTQLEPDPQPFRFGAVVGDQPDAREWSETARRLESAGAATLLVPDTTGTPSPFIALAAAAAVTTDLRVGTWVLAAPFRTPAAVVRETAALQWVSGDRFELGIGAGLPFVEATARELGGRWGTPGQRVDQVVAAVKLVRAEVTPAPPIVMAGSGPRLLAHAARLADVVALAISPTTSMSDVAALAQGLREQASGQRRPEGLPVVPQICLQLAAVGDQLPTWITERMSLGVADLVAADAAAALPADPAAAEERLLELRERTGISYLTFPGQFLDGAREVIGRLSGR